MAHNSRHLPGTAFSYTTNTWYYFLDVATEGPDRLIDERNLGWLDGTFIGAWVSGGAGDDWLQTGGGPTCSKAARETIHCLAAMGTTISTAAMETTSYKAARGTTGFMATGKELLLATRGTTT